MASQLTLIDCPQYVYSKYGQIHGILMQWTTDNKLTTQITMGSNYSCYKTLETGNTICLMVASVNERFYEITLLFNFRIAPPLWDKVQTHAPPEISPRIYLQTKHFYMFQYLTSRWKGCVHCGMTHKNYEMLCQNCHVRRRAYKYTTKIIMTWLTIADYIDLPRDLVLLIARTLDELAQTSPGNNIGLRAVCPL